MIHQSSMLVDLNISVWTGRKLDKRYRPLPSSWARCSTEASTRTRENY
jgi:hypothetical protein